MNKNMINCNYCNKRLKLEYACGPWLMYDLICPDFHINIDKPHTGIHTDKYLNGTLKVMDRYGYELNSKSNGSLWI